MNPQLLEQFRSWYEANERKLKDPPLSAKIKRSEIEDGTLSPPLHKASIDLRTERILASFTVWGTNDLSVIIMSNDTAKELVVDDRHLRQSSELHSILDHYTNAIVNGGPFVRARAM